MFGRGCIAVSDGCGGDREFLLRTLANLAGDTLAGVGTESSLGRELLEQMLDVCFLHNICWVLICMFLLFLVVCADTSAVLQTLFGVWIVSRTRDTDLWQLLHTSMKRFVQIINTVRVWKARACVSLSCVSFLACVFFLTTVLQSHRTLTYAVGCVGHVHSFSC